MKIITDMITAASMSSGATRRKSDQLMIELIRLQYITLDAIDPRGGTEATDNYKYIMLSP